MFIQDRTPTSVTKEMGATVPSMSSTIAAGSLAVFCRLAAGSPLAAQQAAHLLHAGADLGRLTTFEDVVSAVRRTVRSAVRATPASHCPELMDISRNSVNTTI